MSVDKFDISGIQKNDCKEWIEFDEHFSKRQLFPFIYMIKNQLKCLDLQEHGFNIYAPCVAILNSHKLHTQKR